MLTILTTTYNCAPYIYLAVKSILNQTCTEFEYIIVDDGSADNTEFIINSFNDDRIKYIKTNHIGRGAALNLGIKEAKGDIIALQDADDISHPRRLEIQLSGKNQALSNILLCDVAYFKNNCIHSLAFCSEDFEIFKKKLILHGPFFHATMIIKKEHIVNHGGYREDLEANEDHELFLRLINKSNFVVTRGSLYFVRLRKNSLSNKPSLTYQIQKKYFENLRENFDNIPVIEEDKLLGWREFYYGNKNLARQSWIKINFLNWNIKILIAYILTFLPQDVIESLISNRKYLRIKYLLNRLTKFRRLQSEFKNVLNKIV